MGRRRHEVQEANRQEKDEEEGFADRVDVTGKCDD